MATITVEKYDSSDRLTAKPVIETYNSNDEAMAEYDEWVRECVSNGDVEDTLVYKDSGFWRTVIYYRDRTAAVVKLS